MLDSPKPKPSSPVSNLPLILHSQTPSTSLPVPYNITWMPIDYVQPRRGRPGRKHWWKRQDSGSCRRYPRRGTICPRGSWRL